MKAPLFEFPSYQYEVKDWDYKKKGILNRINKQEFVRQLSSASYDVDRSTNNKSYVNYLSELLKNELTEFCEEAQVTCKMTDAWCVKYQKDDYQMVHNHRGWGFSAVLYVEYDPRVHIPTSFVVPWQDPATDTTSIFFPQDIKEGSLFIFPSFTHHFVKPNKSRKPRVVISFDLLPELPEHQSLNKNV